MKRPLTRMSANARHPTMRRAAALLSVLMACANVLAGAGPVAAQVEDIVGEASAREALDVQVFGHADYDWAIRPLGGETTTLEAFRGEVLFINLWASWCTPCVREMAGIERLREALAGADVTFLVVAADEERPVRRFLHRYGYDLPVYLEEQRIPSAFGLRGLPTTWVVDRLGRIVLLRHGEAVWDTPEVEAFVRSVAGS